MTLESFVCEIKSNPLRLSHPVKKFSVFHLKSLTELRIKEYKRVIGDRNKKQTIQIGVVFITCLQLWILQAFNISACNFVTHTMSIRFKYHQILVCFSFGQSCFSILCVFCKHLGHQSLVPLCISSYFTPLSLTHKSSVLHLSLL